MSKLYRRTSSGHHLRTLKSALLERTLVSGLSEGESVAAVKDVSFTVAKGEAVGLIGSNGSGKSTLLKVAAGILRPTRGTIDISGRVAALIELGAGFHPEISGRENIFINGAVLGLTKRSSIWRFVRPSTAPLMKMFSRPEISGWKPAPSSMRAATRPEM
ncbi:MAG: ATP-binding cassette domain-containing protein, partial [Acidobacteriota bacterium]